MCVKRKVSLTEAGSVFLKYGETILANEEKMVSEVRKIAEKSKETINLGIPGSRGETYLPFVLPKYRAVCPQVRVNVVEGYSQQLEEMLMADTIDLAITTLPIQGELLTCKILADDIVMLAASRQSSLAKKFDLSQNSVFTPYLISPGLLADESFMLVKSGYGTRRISDAILQRHGIRPTIYQEFTRHDTAVRMSAVSNQLCITPCSTVVRLNLCSSLCFFTLDDPVVNRHIVAVYRKDRNLSENDLKLIGVVQEVSKQFTQNYVQVKQVKVLDGEKFYRR